LGVGAQG